MTLIRCFFVIPKQLKLPKFTGSLDVDLTDFGRKEVLEAGKEFCHKTITTSEVRKNALEVITKALDNHAKLLVE
jgi:bisphosphoglycerate-dependent phosphoglycerate mutase